MNRSSFFLLTFFLLLAISSAPYLSAQQQGPIAPPPSSGSSAGMTSTSGPAAAPPTHGKINGFSESPISSEPPSQPVDQVIQKMAQHESEFKRERDNYTYTQNFVFQTLDADDQPDSQAPLVSFNIVTPGYFDAVGMPLIAGRDFTTADGADAPRVAIVNTVAARMLWPHQNPLGKRWRGDKNDARGWATVVGVVTSVRQHVRSDDEGLGEVIVPQAQYGNQTLTWALRTSGPPAALAAPVRALLHRRDPNLVFADVRTLDEHVRFAVWEPRVYAQLFGVFSFVALVIAALGIYGVMAYSVAQRTREIGIRMALGAARADVQRLVVGQALRLTLLGSGIGLAAAYALTRFMQAQLHGVRPDDPPTFVGVTLILALSSAAAAWLPTARAVRVDPVVALRHE